MMKDGRGGGGGILFQLKDFFFEFNIFPGFLKFAAPGGEFGAFEFEQFTDVLKEYGVKISMDGRGRCHDNAKMERFWWSLKYEDLLIKEYKSLPQLRRGVQGYVNFYNGVRLHSALNYRTPDAVYEEGLHNRAALLLQKKKTNTCNQNKEDVY